MQDRYSRCDAQSNGTRYRSFSGTRPSFFNPDPLELVVTNEAEVFASSSPKTAGEETQSSTKKNDERTKRVGRERWERSKHSNKLRSLIMMVDQKVTKFLTMFGRLF